MSTWARPSSSRARTSAGRPMRRAVSSTRARSAPDKPTSSPATVAKNPWRRYSARSAARRWGSRPASQAWATATSDRAGSRAARDSASSASTSMSSSRMPPAATWSRADRASRAEPRPRRTAASRASSGSAKPVAARTWRSSADSVSDPRRRNSKCCVRLRMVGSTFWASVVANTKTTCPGGSSSVFNNAFDAAVESMCTSSTMYTFHRPGVPSAACATRSRMASTPLFDAASSSCTSSDAPRAISTQESHRPQGSPSSSAAQLSALARMRAVEVLPVPRGPLKR
jgi:hypothetical protein